MIRHLARQLIRQSGEAGSDADLGLRRSADQQPGRRHRAELAPEGGLHRPPERHSQLPTAASLQSGLQDEFGGAGWGPDWPNASTVIPTLFTPDGGFDLSRVSSDNYPAFESAVADALTTMDRQQQALKWQALDQQASDQAFVIPTFWGLQQTIAGNHVGNLYRWPAYGGTWPYAQLYPTF